MTATSEISSTNQSKEYEFNSQANEFVYSIPIKNARMKSKSKLRLNKRFHLRIPSLQSSQSHYKDSQIVKYHQDVFHGNKKNSPGQKRHHSKQNTKTGTLSNASPKYTIINSNNGVKRPQKHLDDQREAHSVCSCACMVF